MPRSQVDWPGARYWRELARHFPEARVILTVRDPDAWFDSVQATIAPFIAARGTHPSPHVNAIAEMATRIESSRLLVLRAAWLKDRGEPHTVEASMAKLEASRAANWCARQAVQVHGGAGYMTDFPVERYFRDARITEIYEGTTEIQKIVVARHYLR